MTYKMKIDPEIPFEVGEPDKARVRVRHVLIFTKAIGYVHESIPAAVSYVESLCLGYGWTSIVSADSALIEGPDAPSFDIIVFINNSGELFDVRKEALSVHIKEGRGIVGVHACLASFLDGIDPVGGTPLRATSNIIESIFGAHFLNHPPVQEAEIHIDRKVALDICPILSEKLPERIRHRDEYFNYSSNPADIEGIKVLASVKEESYEGGLMGVRHPIVWYRYLGKNKAPVFYCGIGHFSDFYVMPEVNIAPLLLRAGFEFVSRMMNTK